MSGGRPTLGRSQSAPNLQKVVLGAEANPPKKRSTSANRATERKPHVVPSHQPLAAADKAPATAAAPSSSTAGALQRMNEQKQAVAALQPQPAQEKSHHDAHLLKYMQALTLEIEAIPEVKQYASDHPTKGTVAESVRHVIDEGAQVLLYLLKSRKGKDALYYDGKLTPFMLTLAHLAAQTGQYDNTILHVGLGQGDTKYLRRMRQGNPALTASTLAAEYKEMVEGSKPRDQKSLDGGSVVARMAGSDSDESPPATPKSHGSSDDSDDADSKVVKTKAPKPQPKILGSLAGFNVFMAVSTASQFAIGGPKLGEALARLKAENVAGVDFLLSGTQEANAKWLASVIQGKQKKAVRANQAYLDKSSVSVKKYTVAELEQARLDEYKQALQLASQALLKEASANDKPLCAALIKSVVKHFMPPVIPDQKQKVVQEAKAAAATSQQSDGDLKSIVDTIFQVLSAKGGDANIKLNGAAKMLTGYCEKDASGDLRRMLLSQLTVRALSNTDVAELCGQLAKRFTEANKPKSLSPLLQAGRHRQASPPGASAVVAAAEKLVTHSPPAASY